MDFIVREASSPEDLASEPMTIFSYIRTLELLYPSVCTDWIPLTVVFNKSILTFIARSYMEFMYVTLTDSLGGGESDDIEELFPVTASRVSSSFPGV